MRYQVLRHSISWAIAQHKGYIGLLANDNSGKPTLRFGLDPETSEEFLNLLSSTRGHEQTRLLALYR